MKLHADPPTALNAITAYGPGFVEINRIRHMAALLLLPSEPVRPWNVGDFEGLGPNSLDPLLDLRPDLVLLGTGNRQRFPRPEWTAALRRLRIGIEAMDTWSACRTYNILVAEGRAVAAALIIDAA
ncbi:MAG TPA: Mth938-like domain-containing protein [Burkholderiaceae bacterium]|nr:Mth938-like domain-containing protein [Burkholderiaceae bacterium]